MIIFQPELRKALEQLGSKKSDSQFRAGERKAYTHINQELIAACSVMSENKTGAIDCLGADAKSGGDRKDRNLC